MAEEEVLTTERTGSIRSLKNLTKRLTFDLRLRRGDGVLQRALWEKNLPGGFRNNFKTFSDHQRGLDTEALRLRERESWAGVREGPQRKGEFCWLQNRAVAEEGRMAQFDVQA